MEPKRISPFKRHKPIEVDDDCIILHDNLNDFDRVVNKKDITDELPAISKVAIPKLSLARKLDAESDRQQSANGKVLTSSEIAMRDCGDSPQRPPQYSHGGIHFQ